MIETTIRAIESNPTMFTLAAGETLLVTADAASTGWAFQSSKPGATPYPRVDIAAGDSRAFGPYIAPQDFKIVCTLGSLDINRGVDIAGVDEPFAASRIFGAVVLEVGDSTLMLDNSHHGKTLNFTAECTVTIPASLRSDFLCKWSQEASNPVTFSAGAGVTLNSPADAVSGGQYASGELTAFAMNTYRLAGNLAAVA